MDTTDQKEQPESEREQTEREDRELTNKIQHAALTTPIMQYFEFMHLPEHLRPFSRAFAQMASSLADVLPSSAELTTGLRKLLESKDCIVRARLTAWREQNVVKAKEAN